MPNPQNFTITVNNYENDYEEKVGQIKDLQYLIFGEEIAPTTGTPHLQGYIQFSKQKRLTTAVNILQKIYPGCHVEIARGSSDENYEYCKKGGKFKEYGTMVDVQPGKRSDLTGIANRILNEGERVDDILSSSPGEHHRIINYMDRLQSITDRQTSRDFMTEGYWLYGETGVGKTKSVYDFFNKEDIYNHTDDRGWWDNYQGQKVCLIDDFRGFIPYNILLKLCDRYPFTVPQRNRSPRPFISKYVIITSSLPPDEVYRNLAQNDSIAQLLRRFKVIEFDQDMVINF